MTKFPSTRMTWSERKNKANTQEADYENAKKGNPEGIRESLAAIHGPGKTLTFLWLVYFIHSINIQ